MKKTLILSWNGVPTKENTRPISATGMRCYKLARGLCDNNVGKVDIAVKNADFVGSLSSSMRVISWENDEQIVKLASGYDSIILNAGYGESALYILENVSHLVVKVVDLFIPFYYEDAFIHSDDNTMSNSRHIKELKVFHSIVQLADYMIVASEAQLDMYLGAFGGVNLLNFSNFKDYGQKLLIAPPGIMNDYKSRFNPYDEYKNKIGDRKIVVWYGSLYKWYEFNPILKAFSENKAIFENYILFVVGAENPEFMKEESEIYESSLSKNIVWIPWVEYENRLDWLKYANCGVTFNRITLENRFSYRNRLLDFAEVQLPFMTNGGDPLGEKMIDLGLAYRVSEDISKKDFDDLLATKQDLSKIKSELSNSNLHAELASAILTKPGGGALNDDFLSASESQYSVLMNRVEGAESSLQSSNETIDVIKNELANAKLEIKRQKEVYEKLPKTTRSFVKRSIKQRIRGHE